MTRKTTDAVEILRRRYVGDDPRRQEMLREERINAEVASQIYAARKRAGLNQKQLAQQVGTTQSVISRLEDADYGRQSLQMLQRIAEALGEKLEVRFAPQGDPIATSPDIGASSVDDVPIEIINEIRRRDWIPSSVGEEESANQLRLFLGPRKSFRYAARQGCSRSQKENQVALECWLQKLEIEAERIDVTRFSASKLKQDIPELVRLSSRDDGPVRAVGWLEERGVRCIFIKQLSPHLDGAAMVVDDAKPAIGLTLRLDKVDSFWFTLLHEIGHVCLYKKEWERNPIVDEDIEQESSDKVEKQADRFAANSWVSSFKWKEFRSRVGQFIKNEDISCFAKSLGVAPGLVAGRLQRELGRWTHYRGFLGEGTVRDIISEHHRVF